MGLRTVVGRVAVEAFSSAPCEEIGESKKLFHLFGRKDSLTE